MYNNLKTREEVIKLIKEYNPSATFEVVTKEINGVKHYIVRSIDGLYISSYITENSSVAYFREGEYIYFIIYLRRDI